MVGAAILAFICAVMLFSFLGLDRRRDASADRHPARDSTIRFSRRRSLETERRTMGATKPAGRPYMARPDPRDPDAGLRRAATVERLEHVIHVHRERAAKRVHTDVAVRLQGVHPHHPIPIRSTEDLPTYL